MKFKCSILLCLTFCLIQKAVAKDEQCVGVFCASNQSVKQIESVIFDKYIGGQVLGSVDLIRSAFSPDAVMLTPKPSDKNNGALRKWLDMHSEVEQWAVVPNKSIKVDEVKILSLDIIDERLATVQIKMESRVYEVVTLVKINEEWKIASKVYVLQK